MLRELANVFVRPLLIISAVKLWQMGGIPEEGNKVYVSAIFKKGNVRSEASQFHLYPRERMEQIIVEMFPQNIEDRRVIWNDSIAIQWTNHA